MESLQLKVNHCWFGFMCKSSPRFYCTVSVTARPRITLRGTGTSLETLSTLPRPVRPIFSKISDKLISFHHVSYSSSKSQWFLSRNSLFRSNRQETIHNAWCYNIFLQPDKAVWDGFCKESLPWNRCPSGYGYTPICSRPSKNSEPSRNLKDLKRRLDHFGTFWAT